MVEIGRDVAELAPSRADAQLHQPGEPGLSGAPAPYVRPRRRAVSQRRGGDRRLRPDPRPAPRRDRRPRRRGQPLHLVPVHPRYPRWQRPDARVPTTHAGGRSDARLRSAVCSSSVWDFIRRSTTTTSASTCHGPPRSSAPAGYDFERHDRRSRADVDDARGLGIGRSARRAAAGGTVAMRSKVDHSAAEIMGDVIARRIPAATLVHPPERRLYRRPSLRFGRRGPRPCRGRRPAGCGGRRVARPCVGTGPARAGDPGSSRRGGRRRLPRPRPAGAPARSGGQQRSRGGAFPR